MKSFVFTTVFSFLANICIAQFSIFAGGGVNMTTDNIGGYHYDNLVRYSITPSVGGGGEIGSSYLVKKHHLISTQLKFTYHEFNTTTGVLTKTPNGNEVYMNDFYDTYTTIGIPLLYGYSINNLKRDHPLCSYIPYVGWLNEFVTSIGNYTYKKTYLGSLLVGFRFRIRVFYIDCSYTQMLTPFNDNFDPTIRLQTINLSLGYVYTFKTKAERQSKKE